MVNRPSSAKEKEGAVRKNAGGETGRDVQARKEKMSADPARGRQRRACPKGIRQPSDATRKNEEEKQRKNRPPDHRLAGNTTAREKKGDLAETAKPTLEGRGFD